MSGETQHAPPVRRASGDGSIFQKRYTDRRTGATKKTDMLYMKFYVGGKPVVEATGTTNRNKANKALRRRLGEIASGRYIPADVETTTFGQVKQMAFDHYRANGRKSLDRFEDAVSHLSGFFPDQLRVRDISPDRITPYVAARKEEKAANATINRELAALKLMLRLGERAGRVVNRVYIGMLEENNRRKGFVEDDQFVAIQAHLPPHLKAPMEVGFITGWRVKSEILTRQKSHLDLKAGWLRLEPGETKNGEGSDVPASPPSANGTRSPGSENRGHRKDHGPDHSVALPSQRQANQVLPSGMAHRVPQGRIRSGRLRAAPEDRGLPHPARFPPHGDPKSGTGGHPPVRRDGDGGHKTESVYRRYGCIPPHSPKAWSAIRYRKWRVSTKEDAQQGP